MVRAVKGEPPTTSRRNVFARRTERRVFDYIREQAVVRQGERAVVAVSGGPDSSALLAVLTHLLESLGVDLIVAHFDHRLRGEEQARVDLAHVASLASRYRLPFVHSGGDVMSRAHKRGESIEDAARRLRYAFLAREAKEVGASVVLTGHTMDDQAETVLLHIIRGSGIDGLVGMRPRSSWPFHSGPDLARPLLCLRREETERYCLEVGMEPCADETNQLLTAARNRVRLRVLPELRALNPRVVDALARLAQAAAADSEYLAATGEREFRSIAKRLPGGISLPKQALVALPRAIAARVMQRALERVSGSRDGFEATHIEAVLALAVKPPGRLSMPGSVVVASDARSIRFSRGLPHAPPRLPQTTVAVPGTTQAGEWRIQVSLVDRPPRLTPVTDYETFIGQELVSAGLTVRGRRPGDHLRPLGLLGEKKLQDILVDAKVPARERDSVPLICDDAGILWVVGHCIDERAAVREGDPQALHITARKVVDRST